MLSLKGYTSLNDSTEDSYLPALLRSGSHPVTVVFCFPQTGFQLTGEKEMFDMRWFAEFDILPAEKEGDDEDEEIETETETVDFADRENALQDLERFYPEKFRGNVYTEFYDGGGIKNVERCKRRQISGILSGR